MNIAVIVDKDIHEGGSFQYSLSTLLLLRNKQGEHNLVFFTTRKQNIAVLKENGFAPFYLSWTEIDEFFSQIQRSLLISNVLRKLKVNIRNRFDRILGKHNIDLIYFLSSSPLALVTDKFNYIWTVWDLCFRDDVEFPEVYKNREFERREQLYKIALGKAVNIITDSEFTKQNIIKKYGSDEKRITVFPLLPSPSVNISEQEYTRNYVDIKKKYNINGNYIFYPAQFWAHKNHVYILEGLKILKEKWNNEIHAVFVGSDKGNLSYVLKKAGEFGLRNQIHYLGFVENQEMPYLYRQSLALVMPTYLGPTNMPPLEAFMLKCPVLYSDLPDLHDQVKDAVIWLDLRRPETMCKGLLRIINNEPEVDKLVENGKKKIECLMKNDYWDQLKIIFDDYSLKLKCWK